MMTLNSLDEHPRYKALVAKFKALNDEEKSIKQRMTELRDALSRNPQQSDALAGEIIPLESRILQINKEKSRLTDSINVIEKGWIAVQYQRDQEAAAAPELQTAKPSAQQTNARNLVANSVFRQKLNPQDYVALKRAQAGETEAADLASRYIDNHTTLNELAAVYDTIKVEDEAVKIEERFTALDHINRTLGDSLLTAWNEIFDSKLYAYTYILDRMGREDLLSKQEDAMNATAQQVASLRDSTASDQLVTYYYNKVMMLRYEQQIADAFALYPARDSLLAAERMLSRTDFKLSKCRIKERYFIDYEPVKVSHTSPYNWKNPIPECKIYERGSIYRIRLGSFMSKRPISIFRNVSPLSFRQNEKKRWEYYAGALATYEEAVAARNYLKKIGFRAPEIVLWNDGEISEPGQDSDASGISFRVELSGKTQLSDAVRQAIEALPEGHQFSRVGEKLYVVGGFFDKASADQLMATLSALDGELEIKVVEIAKNPQ